MKYSPEFKKLVAACLATNSYVGIGNPNAKILFVGKEAAIDHKEVEKTGYVTNAEEWQEIIDTSRVNHLSIPNVPKGDYLRKAGVTWRKYQLLHDAIFQEDPHRNGEGLSIDFMRHIFTTEMNDAPHKTTHEAQKKEDFRANLKARRESFFSQQFIQDFPVIVLACSNYIRNHGEHREINDTFGVAFTEQRDIPGTNQRFWIHHSSDPKRPKLVIHCRQLSGAVHNDFLQEMGSVIRDYLREERLS